MEYHLNWIVTETEMLQNVTETGMSLNLKCDKTGASVTKIGMSQKF